MNKQNVDLNNIINNDKPTFLSWAFDDVVADAEQECILRAAETASKVTSLNDILFQDRTSNYAVEFIRYS